MDRTTNRTRRSANRQPWLMPPGLRMNKTKSWRSKRCTNSDLPDRPRPGFGGQGSPRG